MLSSCEFPTLHIYYETLSVCWCIQYIYIYLEQFCKCQTEILHAIKDGSEILTFTYKIHPLVG